jgi:hypothetical protein
VLEFLLYLLHLVEALHNAKQLIDAARSNPQAVLTLLILLLAGIVVAIAIHYTRRRDFPNIR